MENNSFKRCLGAVVMALLLGVLSACGGGGGGGDDSSASATTPGGGGCNIGGSGTVILSWAPPTTNQDGSPASLAEFRVYCSAAAGDYSLVRTVSALDTATVVDTVSRGTSYFAVTAVSTTGLESGFSDIRGIVVD